MSGTATDRFDEIFSTSLQNYKKTLADNIFDSLPFFDVMNKESGEVNEDGERGGLVLEDSAADIIEPIIYGKNTTVSSYSGYDVIDTTPQTGLGNAKYTMKQVAGTVTIDRFSERQNASKQQIINLFSAKMQQLEMSFRDSISVMIFGDGTGNDSKDISGLLLLVADTPTSGTVGGIDRATYTFWRNYTDDGAHASAAYDALLADMRTMYLNLCIGKEKPNFAVSSLATYAGFEGKLLATINYNIGMSNLLRNADYGFDNYKFHNCTYTFDNDCYTDNLYMLNTKFLKFHVDKQTYFENMPFQRPYNQDCRTSIVLLYGELCCSNCRMQGVLEDIT